MSFSHTPQSMSHSLAANPISAQDRCVLWSQAQAAQQHQYLRTLMNSPQISKTEWMWNGVAMDVVDFARHAYGDTPEATHFVLKHSK